MWVPLSPRPPDFCGRPPCPQCYGWQEGKKPPMSGLHKMALDLLEKPLDDLSKDQRKELNGVARKIHKDGMGALASPPDESPPPPADIGMSGARQLEGWLKRRRQAEPTKARQLTCDEVVALQAERAAEAKEKKKQKDERLKEAREMAEVFAQADRSRQSNEQSMLQGVDPNFVDYCQRRGIYDPREIYSRWQQEYSPMRAVGINGDTRYFR